MGVVEIWVGNFPEQEQFSGNFAQLVDRAIIDHTRDRSLFMLRVGTEERQAG